MDLDRYLFSISQLCTPQILQFSPQEKKIAGCFSEKNFFFFSGALLWKSGFEQTDPTGNVFANPSTNGMIATAAQFFFFFSFPQALTVLTRTPLEPYSLGSGNDKIPRGIFPKAQHPHFEIPGKLFPRRTPPAFLRLGVTLHFFLRNEKKKFISFT